MEKQRNSGDNSLFKPVGLPIRDVQKFDYRMGDVVRSLTKTQVELFTKLQQIKLILGGRNMKRYFETKQNEKRLLVDQRKRISKLIAGKRVTLEQFVPAYLTPTFAKLRKKKERYRKSSQNSASK